VLVFSKDAVSISVDGWTQAADPIYGSAGSAGPPVVAAFDEVLTTQLQVRISDGNLNSVPTSSPIAVTVSDQSPTKPVAKSDGSIQACAKTSVSHDKIPNSLNPLTLTIGLAKCVKGDSVNVKVETEAGSFEQAFIVP
jgi:hypothetical protein